MNSIRYQILAESLTMVEANQRRFSKNNALVSPREGYEMAWQQERTKADEIRRWMQEVRYGKE